MSDMTPEKAQALLDHCNMLIENGWQPDPEFFPTEAAPDLARAYIAQSAELTHLRARIEAADKLAEVGGKMIDFHNGPTETKRPDIWQRLLQRFSAALSAYGEAGK